MCRIVIEQILAGEPPRAVASTLQNIARDIASLGAEGAPELQPRGRLPDALVGALGAAGFISTERTSGRQADPSIQASVLDAILSALFATPPRPSVRGRNAAP